MNLNTDDDTPDLSAYQVHSRREIVSLLRNVGSRNQLVRMQTRSGADSAVTSVLHVDDADGSVIIDCASSATVNQRMLESEDISFETVLENIRILFSASHAEDCIYEDRPALRIPMPESLIRLQRREYYRVMTPISSPVRCAIQVPAEAGGTPTTLTMPLYNVSAGGIAVVDEKKQLSPESGQTFENCRIDLPGGAVVLTLRFRNAQDLTLTNGRSIRRIGFMFEHPPNAVLAAIQRYITKLEREQNARATGLG
ncbi:MAG: flagellar brake protein [Noviherbaspirillum sp.]